MDLLHCKTRAGSSPAGKPRLYFCAHPDDFSVYFETLSKELLSLWDCAIWYADTSTGSPWGTAVEEEFTLCLRQMQLFVIPVSESFLREKNDAREREFALAVENHIPVLPILVNSGLANEFNTICGNIQFLDRTSTDLTEIPYLKKLETFLGSVLLSDDLAQKVRSAFDAYVFLSYRKKDRKYAQELMQLIHENDFCRDIAIWYDEFLTPGEDFNDSIRSALQKSTLFALAVTPNLVNEKNYVMDVEYPMAQKQNKKILPVELQDTNRLLLKWYFKSLPKCVAKNDKQGLSSSLAAIFRDIAVRETDSSPEHLLFIGLAYLNGIDVEVDSARGVKLITRSAEGGLPQAMEKLVQLYRRGNGVPLDQEQAIAWQQRLVEKRQEVFEKTGEHGKELLQEMQQLAELYLEIENISGAAEVCRNAHIQLARSADQLGPGEVRAYTLWLHSRQARCLETQGKLAEAEQELQSYLALASRWVKEQPTWEAMRSLAISYDRLGQLRQTEGDLAGALEMFREGKQRTRLADEQFHSTDTMGCRLTMGIQCGRLLMAQKNLTGAMKEYDEVLPLAERLEESGTPEGLGQLAVCYLDLSRLYAKQHLMAEAADYGRKALALLQKRADQEPSMQNLRKLGAGFNTVGDTLIFLKSSPGHADPEIRDTYQKALEIFEKLTRRYNSSSLWLDLAFTQDRLSRYYGLRDETETEIRLLSQAIASAQKAVDLCGDVEAKRALSGYWARMGQVYAELAYLDDSYTGREKDAYRKRFALNEEIYRQTKSVDDLVSLASDHQVQSGWAQAEEDYETALLHKKESIRLCEQAVAADPSVASYKEILSIYRQNLADMLQRRQTMPDALPQLTKALTLAEELWKNDPSLPNRLHAAEANGELGEYYVGQGNWEKARPYYQRYLELWETADCRQPEKEQLHQAADACSRFVAAARRCKQYAEAKPCALRFCQLRERISQLEPGNLSAYSLVAYAYRLLVGLCLSEKDFDEAETYANKYIEKVQNIPARFPQVLTCEGCSLREYAAAQIWLLVQDLSDQAETFREGKEREAAESAYELAIDYAELFVQENPGDLHRRDQLARMHYNMARLAPDGYYSYYLEQALALWEELARMEPENTRYVQNAKAVREILG